MSFLSMTKTLVKSIFHGPYTELYPAAKRENYERTRGRIEIDISNCIFCGLCEKRCPTGAIQVDKACSKWSIGRLSCIQCNYCTEVCPKKCLKMSPEYSAPTTEKDRDEYSNA